MTRNSEKIGRKWFLDLLTINLKNLKNFRKNCNSTVFFTHTPTLASKIIKSTGFCTHTLTFACDNIRSTGFCTHTPTLASKIIKSTGFCAHPHTFDYDYIRSTEKWGTYVKKKSIMCKSTKSTGYLLLKNVQYDIQQQNQFLLTHL